MNPLFVQKDSQKLYLQRNLLAIIVGLMFLTNFVLAICLFSKSERTIIIPAHLNQEVTFSGSNLPESYIEEMTNYFIGHLLDLTPSNVGYKAAEVLKHVDPGAYQELKKYFNQEEEKHRKYNLSTSFSLIGIKAISPFSREIEGILTSRFGDTGRKDTKVHYLITYKSSRGRLLLQKFELLGEEKQ